MISDDLQQFKGTFITESFEQLADMEERLLQLEEGANDLEELNAIFRAAHSIKGGAGAFGFTRITGFTHILEGLLDSMREGALVVTREAVDLLLLSNDVLKQMIIAAQNDVEAEAGIEDELSVKLKVIAASGDDGGENTSEGEADSSWGLFSSSDEVGEASSDSGMEEISIFEISFIPNETIFLSGNEPLLLIRELYQLGDAQVMAECQKLPEYSALNPEYCYLSWVISLDTTHDEERIKEVFEFVEDDCTLKIERIGGFSRPKPQAASAKIEVSEGQKEVAQAAPAEPAIPTSSASAPASAAPPASTPPPAAAKQQAVSSIRVDTSKIDRLVNIVGELVISQAMVHAQARKLPPEQTISLLSEVEQMSQFTVELQEAVMGVRMQPVKSVFSRMPRAVRDLSGKLGKDIQLEMIGENTELDKTVIEQLNDPLMHMIRNSVDHGVEGPDARVAAGKPAQGTIKLSAEHRAGRIVITISDDGAGINRERVYQKAVEKGLVSEGAQLADQEIDDLIFRAGFSTAEVLSDISGRGVGMDVVKQNIESLGGTVSVTNYPGKGSVFEVTLPLTLAILDGMIVRVGREQYIVPISSIIETLRPRKEEISLIAGGSDTINFRGEYLSVLYLHDLFGIPSAIKNAAEALLIVIDSGKGKFGLLVDELIGQQQVVIKSLEENFKAVQGISAATILGDGKVSLILDVVGLQTVVKAYDSQSKHKVATRPSDKEGVSDDKQASKASKPISELAGDSEPGGAGLPMQAHSAAQTDHNKPQEETPPNTSTTTSNAQEEVNTSATAPQPQKDDTHHG